jgi:predicted  nucleic acid-binding Zn-ribbon protein
MSNKQINVTVSIDAEIKALEQKISSVRGSLSKITDNGANANITKMFGTIEKAIDNLKAKSSQPISSQAMFGSMEKDILHLNQSIAGIVGKIQELASSADGEVLDFLPPDLVKNLNSAITALTSFNTAMEAATQESSELA